MSSKGTYYQFNLNLKGDYVRGYMVSSIEHSPFFIITEPKFSNPLLASSVKPINNVLYLSKNAVALYFEINDK